MTTRKPLTLGSQLGMEDRPVVQTLKVEYTESEAFAVWHVIAKAITDLDKRIKAQSDIVYSHTHTVGQRVAAQDARAFLLAERTALQCARIAMSDAGL